MLMLMLMIMKPTMKKKMLTDGGDADDGSDVEDGVVGHRMYGMEQ